MAIITSKQILVIEDAGSIRKALTAIFTKLAHHRVTAVGSAETALELLKNNDGPTGFDLITLDLSLPGMSGNGFLVELPQLAPSVPVVVISASLVNLLGFSQVKAKIQKPFELAQLLTVIAEVLAISSAGTLDPLPSPTFPAPTNFRSDTLLAGIDRY